jgi:hypothetical protein
LFGLFVWIRVCWFALLFRWLACLLVVFVCLFVWFGLGVCLLGCSFSSWVGCSFVVVCLVACFVVVVVVVVVCFLLFVCLFVCLLVNLTRPSVDHILIH